MKAKIKIMILTLLVLFCFIMAARIRFRKLNLEDDKKIEVKTEERYDLNIPSSDMGNDIMSEKGDSRINENPSHITRYVANNIKVDADVIEGKGSYYEYIWQQTRSGSNKVKTTSRNGYTGTEYTSDASGDGTYQFKEFIPGNYIIRFIYGDGSTYDIIPNVKKYNGQDYKSTT